MTREHLARSARGPAERAVSASRRRSEPRIAGYSLVELLFALGLAATLGAAAAPQLVTTLDDARALGASRFVATKLQELRMEAITRSTDVAFQFVPTPDGWTYAAYADGNGNGVRSADVQRGVDSPLTPPQRLADRFSGVDFGVLPGLPNVEPGGTPLDGDPVKLGSSSILTFTPLGTSSSGSLYVRGRRDRQYVIRIFGETGKTRVLRFDTRLGQWKPL